MESIKSYIWDMGLFFRSWFNSPKQMGTVFPSSSATGKKIAALVKDRGNSRVVELGAGTGQVTDELVAMGISSEHFVAIEYDASLCKELLKKHPKDVNLLNIDAADMLEYLPKEFVGQTDYVISTLPLIPLGREKCRKIIDTIFKVLKPGGVFVQVTLSPLKPKYVDELKLSSAKLFISWVNIPPMHVWRLSRNEAKENQGLLCT
eukprot:TRINITY_DN17202_c0_g1_i2.p1 TRINITY_DN17202_c0_g1~~TRINITY_DN17202_c0_g1_i2.p1  ORF type:complete len:233 (+),score=34.41 TRINITY_DN17202_c0_g1_i2:86-700(+)